MGPHERVARIASAETIGLVHLLPQIQESIYLSHC